MTDLVTDTHGLIWYLENSSRLGQAASQAFNACDNGEILIFVPTICLIEIIYLQELGRIPSDLVAKFNQELLSTSSGLVLANLNAEVVASIASIPRKIVPEMPDRIIAATALSMGLPLITKDHAIVKSEIQTIW